jgi:hypothetical protein
MFSSVSLRFHPKSDSRHAWQTGGGYSFLKDYLNVLLQTMMAVTESTVREHRRYLR